MNRVGPVGSGARPNADKPEIRRSGIEGDSLGEKEERPQDRRKTDGRRRMISRCSVNSQEKYIYILK
jgi:hypothetical protein